LRKGEIEDPPPNRMGLLLQSRWGGVVEKVINSLNPVIAHVKEFVIEFCEVLTAF